jgi:hypothetical protein
MHIKLDGLYKSSQKMWRYFLTFIPNMEMGRNPLPNNIKLGSIPVLYGLTFLLPQLHYFYWTIAVGFQEIDASLKISG